LGIGLALMTCDGDGLFSFGGLGFVINGECGSVGLSFCTLGILK